MPDPGKNGEGRGGEGIALQVTGGPSLPEPMTRGRAFWTFFGSSPAKTRHVHLNPMPRHCQLTRGCTTQNTNVMSTNVAKPAKVAIIGASGNYG